MLIDAFGRKIDYLRVSVTDRCNLRCVYCMPVSGIVPKPHADILSFEEIVEIVEAAASLGIERVRLTGGEPLVRKDIVSLVRSLAATPGIRDISMTTNGIFLGQYAADLKAAGMRRINISLNSLSADRYRALTRGGEMAQVEVGISAAVEAGFDLLKINIVLLEDISDAEIARFLRLTLEDKIHIRFIEYMPVNSFYKTSCLSGVERVLKAAERLGLVERAELEGAGPAETFRFKAGLGTFGLIRPISSKFCGSCNRLRLTSDGFLRVCLHSEKCVDLRQPLRRGATRKELQDLFRAAAGMKSKEHALDRVAAGASEYVMCQIGG